MSKQRKLRSLRVWGGGKVQEQVFRINFLKYELLLFKDITANHNKGDE